MYSELLYNFINDATVSRNMSNDTENRIIRNRPQPVSFDKEIIDLASSGEDESVDEDIKAVNQQESFKATESPKSKFSEQSIISKQYDEVKNLDTHEKDEIQVDQTLPKISSKIPEKMQMWKKNHVKKCLKTLLRKTRKI